MGSHPQEYFGVGVGMEAAGQVPRDSKFTLERRHSDDKRWVVIGRFGTKADARGALDQLVASGKKRDDYRVRRTRSSPA